MMMKRIEDFVFRHAAQQGIRYLEKPDLDSTDPILRALFTQFAEEFQTAPPMTLHASAPELLAGYWHAAREAYVVGPKGRAGREAVAATISTLNACPYCETVHSGMFAAAGGGDLEAGNLRPLRDWAASTLSPGSEALNNPGFPPEDIPQIFATATLFHYTNRMVSLFLEDSPVPLPGMATALGTRAARKAMAIMGRRIAGHTAKPGKSAVQRTAELPEAFAWARNAPEVASGLAHFALSAEEAGEEAVPEPVRALVLDHLEGWNGEAPPLSRAWLAPLVAPLAPPLQPIARLALIVARAPWQADDALVTAFREIVPTDRALVQAAGWAAFAAARRIAGWFPVLGDNHLKAGTV